MLSIVLTRVVFFSTERFLINIRRHSSGDSWKDGMTTAGVTLLIELSGFGKSGRVVFSFVPNVSALKAVNKYVS